MICNVCNKRRAKTGSKGTETSPHSDMCNYCWEEGGWENTHSDADHKSINLAELTEDEALEVQGCWICYPELNLAQKPAKAGTNGPKKQGTRRPQLNHKGHSHPATPAARRACKAAFWASLTEVKNVSSNDQLAAAMNAWDHKCDGHGKALQAASATWNVAPLGPKGGVTKSIQAAASKVAKANSK
jgi:hypothetical protein